VNCQRCAAPPGAEAAAHAHAHEDERR